MSTTAGYPGPSLLAILLVVQGRTGSGAEIVFHYPPNPLSRDRDVSNSDTVGEEDGGSSSSESEESSSDDDFALFTRQSNERANTRQGLDDCSQKSDDDEEDNIISKKGTQEDGQWRPSWEPLLGLGEDGLVPLLAPGRTWHKRRFELSINDLTFLGRPVYARQDGLWRKIKSKRIRAVEDEQVQLDATASDNTSDEDPVTNGANHKIKPAPSSSAQGSKSPLTMFHVVFVMDPPPLEHAGQVKDMYDHVVKKFSKVLKWAQAQHDYLYQQAELLQSLKSSHLQHQTSVKAMYGDLVQRSSLASAIARVFESISASKIAAVSLGPDISVSLQIPPITSTSYFPSLSEFPLQPGLWLTTAIDASSATTDHDTTSAGSALQVSKNFTLLLKASPSKILRDSQAAGGPLALPLANLIAHLRPTKSFYKISVASQIALGDIQHLARHLVSWRRALAIPPLHQRDTYMVSPNANMSKLVSACKAYEATFPMMPSLPKMLSALSGTPAPYGSLIPTRDHKEEYLRVLAWLLRDGWITQLRTFAFVRVDPQIKRAVRELDREDQRGTRTPSQREGIDHDREVARSYGSGTLTLSGSGAFSSFKQRPRMRSRPSSEGRQSISTEENSVRGAQQFKHNPKAASLILSPQRAAPEEARWLDYIASTVGSPRSSSRETLATSLASTFSEPQTAELRRYWPLFVKYFTGSEALERIPIRESMKRKFVWDLLGRMGLDFDGAVEDEEDANSRPLVTIRHW